MCSLNDGYVKHDCTKKNKQKQFMTNGTRLYTSSLRLSNFLFIMSVKITILLLFLSTHLYYEQQVEFSISLSISKDRLKQSSHKYKIKNILLFSLNLNDIRLCLFVRIRRIILFIFILLDKNFKTDFFSKQIPSIEIQKTVCCAHEFLTMSIPKVIFYYSTECQLKHPSHPNW